MPNVSDGQTVGTRIVFDTYIETPTKNVEQNIHGGINLLTTTPAGGAVSTGSPCTLTNGTSKLMLVVTGVTTGGTLTITGNTRDRNTGALTVVDTDTIVIDTTVSVDASDTDANGHERHDLTDVYITSKWFTGAVSISATTAVVTAMQVWQCTYEQCNDTGTAMIQTLDGKTLINNTSGRFSLRAYTIEQQTNGKYDVAILGEEVLSAAPPAVDVYYRLRRGNLAHLLNCDTDGFWMDIWFDGAGDYFEDVSLNIWVKLLP